MNRVLNLVNFVGVLILAVLCAAQWRSNSQLRQRIDELEQTRADQDAKLAQQGQILKADAAELADLHQRLDRSDSQLKETQSKLASMNAERDRLTSQRDQLKANIKDWQAAVSQRDALLKQLATERNEATSKFTDLANRYAALMKELNSKAAGAH